ncbi:class F sortase [Streptomyces sp. RB6PN25]|uniref:Class F sortase n=1 Tax=Streptomyces humicola TaxID=2953240 RepID=A0ABT1PZX0_9ACTN|nr:class F sortase [Streptomyces humicola]MCQ4082072.1 class F sortase [Streptomyces humicola]
MALATGAWLMHDGSRTKNPPAPNSADALASAGPSAKPSDAPAVPPLPYSVPDRIHIPAIYVSAPLTQLGLDSNGNLQVPPDTDRDLAGWYNGGPAPGEGGASVIAGHVDTMKGPAVFYNLGSLHKGNTIEVHRKDGSTAVFTIYGIDVYRKTDFPTDKVYADTPGAELRLITCGGGFTKKTGYLGNVVVYARLTGTKQGQSPSGTKPGRKQ